MPIQYVRQFISRSENGAYNKLLSDRAIHDPSAVVSTIEIGPYSNWNKQWSVERVIEGIVALHNQDGIVVVDLSRLPINMRSQMIELVTPWIDKRSEIDLLTWLIKTHGIHIHHLLVTIPSDAIARWIGASDVVDLNVIPEVKVSRKKRKQPKVSKRVNNNTIDQQCNRMRW